MCDLDGRCYVVHTFPTGQGNVVGNPIVPVIKITGNPRTVRTMSMSMLTFQVFCAVR